MKPWTAVRTLACALVLAPGLALAEAPGAPLGGEVELVDLPYGFPYDLAQFRTGEMLVVWQGHLSTSRLVMRRFARNGTPAGPAREVSILSNVGEIAVSAGKGGTAAVVWQGYGTNGMSLYMRRINPAGVPAGNDILVDTIPHNGYVIYPLDRHHHIDVAIGETGIIAVTWAHPILPYLYARFYSPLGTPLGPRIAVGSDLQPVEEAIGVWMPGPHKASVESDRLGNFLVTWATYDSAAGAYVHHHRRLGPGGLPLGLTAGGQSCVAPAQRGDYYGGSLGAGGVLYVQRFGPLGAAKGGVLGGTPGGCDQMLTDDADNFIVRTLRPGGIDSAVHMFSPQGALLATLTIPWNGNPPYTSLDRLTGAWSGQIVHSYERPGAPGHTRLLVQRYAGPQGGIP